MCLTQEEKRTNKSLQLLLPRSTKRPPRPSLFFTWRKVRSFSSSLRLFVFGLSAMSAVFAGVPTEAACDLLSGHHWDKLHKVMTAEKLNDIFWQVWKTNHLSMFSATEVLPTSRQLPPVGVCRSGCRIAWINLPKKQNICTEVTYEETVFTAFTQPGTYPHVCCLWKPHFGD